MKSCIVIVGVFVLMIVTIIPVYGAEKPSMDVQSLFEQKCSICHSSDRAKSKKKTLNEWETTVMRMKNERGAPISDEEAKIIIDYLAKNYGK